MMIGLVGCFRSNSNHNVKFHSVEFADTGSIYSENGIRTFNDEYPTLEGEELIVSYALPNGNYEKEWVKITNEMLLNKVDTSEFKYVLDSRESDDHITVKTRLGVRFTAKTGEALDLWMTVEYNHTQFMSVRVIGWDEHNKKPIYAITHYNSAYFVETVVIPERVELYNTDSINYGGPHLIADITAITNRNIDGQIVGAFENADVEAVLWGDSQNGQPSVLDIIGENAFKGSKVSRVGEDRNIGTEFEAPNSLKTLNSVEFSVEKNAFANCENLEVVSLSQDNVDKEAFKGAINLKEIKVDYNGQQSTWTTFPNDPIYNGVLYPFRTLVPSTDNYWIWPEGKPKP